MVYVIHVRHTNKETVYIGRPSIFGNPYKLETESYRKHVIEQYKKYFQQRLQDDPEFIDLVGVLVEQAKQGDLYLSCYCAPKPCHGDVIKEYIIERINNERGE